MQVSFLLQTLLKKAKQTLPDDVKFQVIPTFLGQGMRLFYDTCQPTRKEVGFAPQVIPTFLGRGMRLFYDTCEPTRKEVGLFHK